MSFSRSNPLGWALFEELTSAQMNALDIDHANALDIVGGGAHAIANPVSTSGEKWTHTEPQDIDADLTFINDRWPKLSTRTLTYRQPIVPVHNEGGSYTIQYGLDGSWRQSGATGQILTTPLLNLPARGLLKQVYVVLKGDVTDGLAHSALPSIMPSLQLFRFLAAGSTWTEIDAFADTSGSVAAYDTSHIVNGTANIDQGIDSLNQFWLRLNGEDGTNSQTTMALRNVFAVVEVTEIGA